MKRLSLPYLLIAALSFLLSISYTQASEFDIDNYKGKVVYLDFWASWCGPCRQSFPFMNKLKAQYEDKGLAVVSINVDESPEAAAKFLDKYPANFDIIYDKNAELAQQYQLKAMPTSFLFNRDGKLVGSHLGFKNKDVAKLTQVITNLLDKN